MLRRLEWSHLFLLILCGWLFVLPTNLFLKFCENQAYLHGLLVDYLLPKLYLSDLFGITLIILSWWPTLSKKKINYPTLTLIALGAVLLLGIRQFWTPHPISATWMWLRLCLVTLLGIGLWSHSNLLRKPAVFWSLVATLIFQTFMAWYQFTYQQSLGGYWFLGEPDLRRGYGLATGVFDGAEKVLAYGTTPHPNVLAGVVVIYCWVISLIYFSRKKRGRYETGGLGLAVVATLFSLWSTQSWAAGGTFLVGLLVLILSIQNWLKARVLEILIGLGLAGFLLIPIGIQLSARLSDQASIYRRAFLNQAAVNIFADQPLAGVGLNQTTAFIEVFAPSREVVRFVQPIHHAGLLWLAETGLLGMSLVLLILLRSKERRRLLIASLMVVPILATDHYFVSLATGQLLMVLLLWSSSLLNIDDGLS